jgi:hypothetical protein
MKSGLKALLLGVAVMLAAGAAQAQDRVRLTLTGTRMMFCSV